ncbi:VWA domain-containing protein [Candidatus Sumerlaeota bacterium]|nr:VWA domain-containing protein [Candidatus Sumerlaeota bacterium]
MPGYVRYSWLWAPVLLMALCAPRLTAQTDGSQPYILFLVERSSGDDSSALQRRCDLLRQWAQSMPLNKHAFGIAVFDSRFELIKPFTILQTEEQRLDWLADFSDLTYGQPECDLRLALHTAVETYPEEARQKVIVLLSEGRIRMIGKEQTARDRQAEELLLREDAPRMTESGVVAHALTLSTQANLQLLGRLTRATGGNVFSADRQPDRVLEHIYLRIMGVAPEPMDYQPRRTDCTVPQDTQDILFILRKNTPRDGFFLTGPHGWQWSSVAPEKDESGKRALKWSLTDELAMLRIEQPESGKWRIETVESPAEAVIFYPNLSLELIDPPVSLRVGHEIPLCARLKSSGRSPDRTLYEAMQWRIGWQKIQDGQLYDEEVLTSEIVDFPDAEQTGELCWRAILAPRDKPGEPILHIKADGRVFQLSQKVYTNVRPQSLTFQLERDSGETNKPLSVRARLLSDNMHFNEIRVQVEVKTPSDDIAPMELSPIGRGEFAESLDLFHETGEYRLRIVVAGKRSDGIVFRDESPWKSYTVTRDEKLTAPLVATPKPGGQTAPVQFENKEGNLLIRIGVSAALIVVLLQCAALLVLTQRARREPPEPTPLKKFLAELLGDDYLLLVESSAKPASSEKNVQQPIQRKSSIGFHPSEREFKREFQKMDQKDQDKPKQYDKNFLRNSAAGQQAPKSSAESDDYGIEDLTDDDIPLIDGSLMDAGFEHAEHLDTGQIHNEQTEDPDDQKEGGDAS